MDPSDRFGINLQRARHRKELSQEDLAGLAGLHPRTISRYERGARAIGLLTALALATALGVELSDLCEGITWDRDKRRFRSNPPSGQ